MPVYQQGWRSGGFVRIGSRGGNPLCGARGRGESFPTRFTGLQCPADIQLPSPAPSSPNWNLSSPRAGGKTSQASSGQWCLPTPLHWCSSWLQPGGRQREAGLAGAGSRALLMLAEQGVSCPEWGQQTCYSTGGFTPRQGFCQGFCRGPLWRERAVPDLPAVHLARGHLLVLDCASPPLPFVPLAFSVKRNSNSTSRPPDKWQCVFAGEERMRGKVLAPTSDSASQDHAALYSQHPCRTAFCNVVFQYEGQLQLQRNENSYMHNLCRRHQRYEAKQLWKHLLMLQPLPILETSSMINHIFQLTLIFFFFFSTKLAKNLSCYKCLCIFAIYSSFPYGVCFFFFILGILPTYLKDLRKNIVTSQGIQCQRLQQRQLVPGQRATSI